MKSLVLILLTAAAGFFSQQFTSPKTQAASLAQEYGVVGAIPSLSGDSAKQAGIDKIADAGFGWMRHEFRIESPINFEQYDAAQAKAKAKGVKTLGLLLFTGSDKTHDDWKSYVQSVVSHYGNEIPAWEIMNEADNYLSPADYVTYLKEAHAIIKGINSSATVVLTGITSRPQTPDFWNGVAAAGGWDYFDVAGLHVYHSGYPEKVNFGGGDLLAEYDRALASLKKNGGGKKIWITETGYKASEVGNEDQANWLARTLILSRSVSAIEKIFIYRLYDDSQATYGLLGSDLSERPAYGAIKNLISHLGGRGTGTRLYPQTKQTLDSLESISGWDTKATSNGSTALSSTTGHDGNGMRISYSFSADQAYAVAEKSLPINGTPQAVAAWFYGDDTRNVWKYRFKDAKGETFQADLGNLVSGWNYKQFTIGADTAYVSWDGDSEIDFPISFHAIVVDRQGGEAQSSGIVDEIVAITGGADLFAFQFGDLVAYWKTSGTGSADLCGARRDFNTSPQYATGVSCSDTPKTAITTASSPTPPATKSSPAPTATVDKAKSIFRVDGSQVPADGQSTYRIVMLLNDAQGKVIKNQKPVLSVEPANPAVVISSPVLVGNEWWSNVSSTEAGDKIIKIKVGSTELASLTLNYIAVVSPSPSPTPSPSPSPLPSPATPARAVWPWYLAGVLGSAGITIFGVWFYRKKKKAKTPKL